MLPDKKTIKEANNLVLMVTGGIGRNIMATAVVRNLKRAFPKKDIIVLAGCPDIFLKNPNIRRVINMGQANFFFEDYILKSKSVVLNAEPYQSFNYLYRRKHFVECWCEMIGIPCDSIYPEIFFSENEQRMAQLYLNKFDREMVLLQHIGGKVPKDKSEKEDITSKSGMYKRSLPQKATQEIAQGLVDRGFMVGSVQHENQFCPSMAEKIQFPIRAILVLIPHVAEVISIDSFLQHGTAVFKKRSLVIWGGTNPKALGYPHNLNIKREVCDNPMCHRPNSYLFDFEPTGFMWDCPHNDKCMEYAAQDILKAFDELTGGRRGKRKKQIGKPSAEKSIDSNSGETNKKTGGAQGASCPVGAGVSADHGQDCPHR